MSKLARLSVLLLLTLLWSGTGEAAKLGNLFIKAAPAAEGQFVDPNLEDTLKDLKARNGDFVIVTDESKADFLIVVLERKGVRDKTIVGTLSVRDGSGWKQATKIEEVAGSWKMAARSVMSYAEKWVKANVKK